MKYKLKRLEKEFKNDLNNSKIILDIESFDYIENNVIKRKVYNIGILNIKTKKGYSFTIKENLELMINILTKENCKRLRLYYNNLESSYLISEKYLKNWIKDIEFKEIVGFNLVNFDIPVLIDNGYQINCKKLVDLYYLVGLALPKFYLDYCYKNKLVTDKKNPMFNAESVYKFISNDNKFKERHSGLYDCLIELKIYEYCKKRIGAKPISRKFSFIQVWKNYIKRFKNVNWYYNSYFKKLIMEV